MPEIVQLDSAGKVKEVIIDRLMHPGGSYTPISALRTWLETGAEEAVTHRLVETTQEPEPPHDPLTQKLIRHPVQVGDDPIERIEVVALTAEEKAARRLAKLAATDAHMPRISEDLIDLLVTKGVIALTELPQADQDKLAERKALRG
ncbi:MAG: hypothetical protein ACE5JZ_03030 [Kiloniellales bacterium]